MMEQQMLKRYWFLTRWDHLIPTKKQGWVESQIDICHWSFSLSGDIWLVFWGTSLFDSGSLWWLHCRQGQHLHQHDGAVLTHSHKHSKQCCIWGSRNTSAFSPSQQKNPHIFRDFAFYLKSFSSLLLPPLRNSHTQRSLSLPKASGLWPTAIHSLLKAMLCMWLLKATLLMPSALFFLCMHICVRVCTLHTYMKLMYMYFKWQWT